VLTHEQMIVRIAVGAALGGVIGYERDRHRRPVGLRTHLIVALTAATFMVISSQFVFYQHYGPSELVEVDTSRIAASVVSAVGFLAGGAILRTGVTVQGLTTAAGIWLVTAIGMSSGAGMFVESVSVTGMGLLALTVLRRFEDKADHIVRRRVRVTLKPQGATPESVTNDLAELCLDVSVARVEIDNTAEPATTLALEVRLNSAVTIWQIVERLEKQPGIAHVWVEVLD
jgi:putative Mg2+ transporter-C (MgtC) family protein